MSVCVLLLIYAFRSSEISIFKLTFSPYSNSKYGVLSTPQKQARKLISDPSPTAKNRLLSFNRTQSRVVTGLLIGHNSLRRHLHLIGLPVSPLRRRCGAEEETSAHILCECESLASLRHAYKVSGLLLLEVRGHQEYKFGGHLEL
jgi:hypothetical protein